MSRILAIATGDSLSRVKALWHGEDILDLDQPCEVPYFQLSQEELQFKRQLNGRWITKNGKKIFIKNKGTVAQRAERAALTHKPVTKEDHKNHEQAVTDVVKMLEKKFKAHRTGNNHIGADGRKVEHPFDALALVGRKVHAIEIKTVSNKNSNAKITMHPHSRLLKLNWAKKNDAVEHTVIRDIRSTRSHNWYYMRGVGSFRVPGRLTRIQNSQHLADLMTGNAKESGWF